MSGEACPACGLDQDRANNDCPSWWTGMGLHVRLPLDAGLPADRKAAVATVETSRQTHVEWAEFLRRNPDHNPGAIGNAEYHEQAVREYDNVLAVLNSGGAA